MGLAQSTPGHWTRRSPFFVAPSLPFSQRCDNPLENCVFFFWFCVCFVVFPPPPFFSFVHANKWTCSYGVAVEMLRWFDTSTAPRRRPTACDGRSEEHLRVECEKDKYGVFQWRETEISSRVCFSSSAQLPLSPSFFSLFLLHTLLHPSLAPHLRSISGSFVVVGQPVVMVLIGPMLRRSLLLLGTTSSSIQQDQEGATTDFFFDFAILSKALPPGQCAAMTQSWLRSFPLSLISSSPSHLFDICRLCPSCVYKSISRQRITTKQQLSSIADPVEQTLHIAVLFYIDTYISINIIIWEKKKKKKSIGNNWTSSSCSTVWCSTTSMLLT